VIDGSGEEIFNKISDLMEQASAGWSAFAATLFVVDPFSVTIDTRRVKLRINNHVALRSHAAGKSHGNDHYEHSREDDFLHIDPPVLIEWC
jgi:hypothetical protein